MVFNMVVNKILSDSKEPKDDIEEPGPFVIPWLDYDEFSYFFRWWMFRRSLSQVSGWYFSKSISFQTKLEKN